MKEIVKSFIEDTMYLLEKEEYYEAFSMWYHHYCGDTQSHDYDYLNELFSIFRTAGIDLEAKSLYDRKQIVGEQMYEYIEDVLTNDSTTLSVDLPNVIRHLNSKLHISLIDLNNIFKDVAKHIMPSHNVRLEPFKIVRNS